MPLNETKELAQIVDETILPMEHSGGDGWTILHGDTLQVIRAFKPQVFDAIITDPPYASGGWKPAEKNRTTNQKYSSMDKENALPDFDEPYRDLFRLQMTAIEKLNERIRHNQPLVVFAIRDLL